jgi:hypothetical protein
VILTGCGSIATRQGFYQPITAELQAGHVDSALQLIEIAREKNKYDEKDRFIYFVDAGLLNHYADQFDTSNEKLHLAETAAEELYTRSVSRAIASMLLNDNVLEYSGEDYEILYTNLIKAMNYVALGNAEDAFVEVRRVNLKLDQLEQKYTDLEQRYRRAAKDDSTVVELEYDIEPVRFHNDAFARYLSMHMYAADGKLDDARIDYDLMAEAFQTQPHIYDFPMPEIQYLSEEQAILSVVGLAGLAPVKEAVNFRLRTDKQLNLVQVLYDDKSLEDPFYTHIPLEVSEDYYFKFSVPKLVDRVSDIQSVEVLANGKLLGQLQLLENVNNVSRETFATKKSFIFIRTLARAITKGLAAHKVKKKVDTGGLEGWLKKSAVDVGTDFLENADLRSTKFLPGKIYVADFEIPPGQYDLTIRFLRADGSLVKESDIPQYQVTIQGVNLVRAFSVN